VIGGAPLREGVRGVLRDFAGGPHIFNLGHGITPEASPEHVTQMIAAIREGAA
jgi:uroporphyrinogen decarboxylase